MTREEAKEMLPIIKAFAEGKTIQLFTNGIWEGTENPSFEELSRYRIKPEPKYRPFESQEECWNEISKHQPFGWVTNICIDQKFIITHVGDDDISINTVTSYFSQAFKDFTFVDGIPFGVQIEN